MDGRRAELQRMRQATEDELADQRAFLTQSNQPAAKVIRATRSSQPTVALHRNQRPPHTAPVSTARPARDDDVSDADYVVEDEEHGGYSAPHMVAPAVLTAIVERDSSSGHTSALTLPPSARSIPLGSAHTGFPATFRVSPAASFLAPTTAQAARKSLFALQRERETAQQQQQRPQHISRPLQRNTSDGGTEPLQSAQEAREEPREADWRETAKAAEATDDRRRISRENEEKLTTMSTEEIEAAQRQLHMSLPPALIARLMHSTAAISTTSKPSTPSTIDRLFGQRPPAEDESRPLPAVEERQSADQRPPFTTPAAPSSATARFIPTNPSPLSYPQSAKTEWMAPLASPAAPPQWQQLTWHTGLSLSSEESSAAQDDGGGSEVGTAWQYWRLDFKGCWLDERLHSSNSEDRYDGLYHHGLHAERAGYSLDEVILLCHSQLPAQRQVMVELLTRVLTRINGGLYAVPQPVSDARLAAVDFNALVMERLMVLGVATVLRVAMDDTAVGIVAAGVRGVEALLDRPEEERRRRRRRLAWNGHRLLPAELSKQAMAAWDKPFQPAAVEDAETREARTEVEGQPVEKDVQDNSDDEAVCRRDVVVGLLRMQLLPRLRFLLEVHSASSDPSSAAAGTETRLFTPLVNAILHILLLIAQHSASAAQAVTATPHLLPVLSSLTLSLPQSSTATVHLLPLLSLLATSSSVVRYLASTGALLQCHSYLLVANGLPGSIATKSSAAAFALARDALQLWRISLATHALEAAVAEDDFTTFFPVLMHILVRRRTAAVKATAERKDEQLPHAEEKEAGWEREETEQVRAAYNVLETLCSCVGSAEVQDDETSSISVTHLASSVDYAIAQFTSSLFSRLPSARRAEHVSCMAGMAHFVASYYQQLPTTAAFSASYSSSQLDRQWQTVWDGCTDSPVIAYVVSQLCSNAATAQSSYSSAIFCFPSTCLSTPGLACIDLLLSLCRWLLASVRLVPETRTPVFERLRHSTVLQLLVRVATAMSDWPVVDSNAALLLHHIVLLFHFSASSFSLSVYRAALIAVCPLLTAGYASEVDELLRAVLLGERWLLSMRTMRESSWTRGRSGAAACAVCDWRSRDAMSASALSETLLPAIHAALELQERKRYVNAIELVQQSVPSAVIVSSYDGSSTWPLLLSRNLLLLTALPSQRSASHSQQAATLRSYIQYLGLLVECNVWSAANERSVAARSLMELLVRSTDCTTDPQLSLPLAHCAHSLLSSTEGSGSGLSSFNTGWLNGMRVGWGTNVFLFAVELVEMYASEAAGEDVWNELLLLLARRELVRDYRLLLFSRCMELDDVAVRGRWPGWHQVLWPREDSAEVLAVYREYVSKHVAREAAGVLCEVAMHHLLCDWLGEAAVRENGVVAGKEAKIRQRMAVAGAVDESVVFALLNYRYTRG